MKRPSVRISSRAVDRVLAGHVWVYLSDISRSTGVEPGSIVTVEDPRGRPLGTAQFSSTSQIALRLFTREIVTVDRAFLERRLADAVAFRSRIVSGSDACRLVFSEADRLPGLIVDRYGETLVLQTLTQGMEALKAEVVPILNDLLHPAGIWERNDAPVREKESLPLISGAISGSPVPQTVVTINGLRFQADLAAGQKTGVYLDQRENYAAASLHAKGPALDCFTSTGGFALHMARAGHRVEAVDSGAAALAAARANASLNALEEAIRFREADVFDLLGSYRVSGRRFGTVVLDPPAFAKTKSAVEGAARGYKEINLRALQLLEPGGILITCSCSYHMSEALLAETVAAAAAETGKTLRVLERRTQAADHPILLSVPETLYLKCLILQVI